MWNIKFETALEAYLSELPWEFQLRCLLPSFSLLSLWILSSLMTTDAEEEVETHNIQFNSRRFNCREKRLANTIILRIVEALVKDYVSLKATATRQEISNWLAKSDFYYLRLVIVFLLCRPFPQWYLILIHKHVRYCYLRGYCFSPGR